MLKQLILSALFGLTAHCLAAQIPTVSDEDLKKLESQSDSTVVLTDSTEVLKRVGQVVTIRAKVVQAKLAETAKGRPIYLNLFAPYPQNPINVVIYEENHAKFPDAAQYTGKTVVIRGRLEAPKLGKTNAKPTLKLRESSQLEIVEQ